jgi:predicted RNase H-like nuclease (RuvC/YqgF family)
MAGAEFKITDAIDPNIVKKLNEIRINIQTTSSEYANFTKQLSDGINFKPGNLREYQSKVDSYNATITKLYASQNRLSELQASQLKLLTDISRKIELLTKPLNTLADKITEVKVNLRGASEDLKNVSQDAENASVSFQEASKKISMTAADFDSIRQTVKAFDTQASELNSRLSDNKETISALRTSLRELSKEYKKGAISEEEYKSKRDATVSQLRMLTEQNKQYSAILRNHTQVAIATAGSYNEMKASMLQLEKEYYNLSQAAREGAKGMDILNNIGKLNQQLKDIDAQMGNYQRNVGNYASGWNGLNVSIQQIARELPALSVSANTFFLAISNNLPIFIDELKKARIEYELAKKSNQTAIPVFKQVLSSLLSWQTALVVGITLLSSYGGEITKWVGSLFDARKEIDYLKQLQEDLNKAQKEGVKNAQDEAVKLDILYRAAVNLNKPMGERKKAVEELKKQYPSYFKNISDENILAGKAADSYQRLSNAILASAKARAVQDRLVEQAKQKLDLEDQLAEKEEKRAKLESARDQMKAQYESSQGAAMDTARDMYGKLNKQVEDLDKEIGSLLNQLYQADKASRDMANSINIGDVTFNPHSADKASDDLAQYMENLRNKMADLSVSLIEDEHQRNLAAIEKEYKDQIAVIKGYSEEEDKYREQLAQERLQKIQEENDRYANAEVEVQIRQKELKLKGIRDSSQEALDLTLDLLELRMQKEITAEKGNEEAILLIRQKYAQEAARIQENFALRRIDRIESEAARSVASLHIGLQEQENEMKASHLKGEISEKDYKKKLYDLTIKFNKEMLLAQISAAEAELKVAEATGTIPQEKIEELRLKLQKLRADFGSLLNDEASNEAEKGKKQVEDWADALKNITDSFPSEQSGFADFFSGINDVLGDLAKKAQEAGGSFSDMWANMSNGERLKLVLGSLAKISDGLNSMMQNIYENRISKIEEEQEANEEAGEQELARIERLEETGAISSEEAEARKRAAEDKTARKNEELEKKKAQLQQKQARWDKANSIIQATIATALAVAKALPNFVLAGIAAAMGAAQIAVIASQPIPKYAKGTDSHKGGLAVVGDGGVPETIVTEKGAYITPSVPTLVDIPKGAKVIPYAVDMDRIKAHANDFDGLMAYRSENDLPPVSIVNDYSELEKKIGHLEKSQQIGFAKLAKAIRENNYQQFSKSI